MKSEIKFYKNGQLNSSLTQKTEPIRGQMLIGVAVGAATGYVATGYTTACVLPVSLKPKQL